MCGWILASVAASLSNTAFIRVDLYPLALHLPRYGCEMMRSSAVVSQTVMLEADILVVQQISVVVRLSFRFELCVFRTSCASFFSVFRFDRCYGPNLEDAKCVWRINRVRLSVRAQSDSLRPNRAG